MSQTIRQQIAQKQAELAELEHQALLAEQTENYKVFAETADANPQFLTIYQHAKYLKDDTINWRKNPNSIDYVSNDLHAFVRNCYPTFRHDYEDSPYTEKMITDVMNLILASETNPEWIDIFTQITALYIVRAHQYNKPPPPRIYKEVFAEEKKGKKSKK
jgi:malate synthase